MVNRPEQRDEIKSFPAREVTMVFIALTKIRLVSFSQYNHDEVRNVPGYSRSVIGSEHKHHLNELGRPERQPSLEPQQTDNTTNPNVFLEYVRNAHTRIHKFLTTLV